MNHLNRIYEKLKQSNPNMDDRQVRQQAWVIRDRILFENTAVASSAAAAAGAAGAGAGGAGGGTKFSKRNPVTTGDFPRIQADHWVVTWADVATDTWRFVVYNFTSGVLSDIVDTGLIYDSSYQWVLSDDEFAVSELGHSLEFRNNQDNKYKIWFFNSNAQVIAVKDLDNEKDFQYTENAIIYLGELDGVSTLYHFDGANVRTHQFPGVAIGGIEVDDASDDDVTQDGSIVIEAPNNQRFYIARPDGSLVEITDDMVGLNTFRTSYNADFIFKIDNDLDIKAISQTGTTVDTFDLTPYSTTSISSSSLYGDNCAYAVMNTSNNYLLLVSYDGDSRQFVSFTYSNSGEFEGALNSNFNAFEIDWYFSQPSFGKTLVYYSNTNQQFPESSLGVVGLDFEIKWLSKGASSFESYSFGTSSVTFIDGIGNWTEDRTFSLGLNPITMYHYDGGEIIVGFLTSGGFVTQSTGILAASCSNVWGKPMGEKSFAVFDVGSDRIWQIYGENSIDAQTMTSANWSWGSGDSDVHRNGTLAVIDQSVGTQSFVYTTQIGLTAGPTYSSSIFNDVDNSGNRTGISTEYQVIIRYNQSGYVEGFYLVSKAGLSDFVDMNLGGDYTVSQVMIGTELISIFLSESGPGYYRVFNYKISPLELVDDFNPGSDEASISLYKNRCRILESYSGTTYNYLFVGAQGTQTLTVEANDINTEANDIGDNN